MRSSLFGSDLDTVLVVRNEIQAPFCALPILGILTAKP